MTVSTTWNLKKYYYDSFQDTRFIEDITLSRDRVKKFVNKYKGKISQISIAKEMLSFLEEDSKLSKSMNKFTFYVYYRFYLNSEDLEVQSKMQEIETLMMNFYEQLLFVQEEIKALGYDKLIEFSKMNELNLYENYFYQYAQNLKYHLDDEVEKALLISSDSENQVKLYQDLTSIYEFDYRGEKLSEEELMSYLQSQHEKDRKEAYLSLKEFYLNKERRKTHASIYTSVLKSRKSAIKLRGYANAIEMQNISEELTNSSVDLLFEVVEENYYLFQDFLKLKAKKLGKNKLEIWDVYAPIITKKEQTWDLEKSYDLVMSTLREFDTEVFTFAQSMFSEERVDVYPQKGKSQGAFAHYDKGEHSFVFLNHTNKLKDVFTMAHELGHAFHGNMSQVQPSQVYQSPLSLAETASVFNELLLSEHLKTQLSKDELETLLFQELDEAFGTIFRQIQYVKFEKKVHDATLNDKEFTYEDFSKVWREEVVKLLGDTVNFQTSAEEEFTWQRIPHIYLTPFYCYSYAFGQLLTYSLYEKYQEQGKNFIPKYKEILKSGGSKTPSDLLKEFDFDLESKEYYEAGINVLKKKIEELKKLV